MNHSFYKRFESFTSPPSLLLFLFEKKYLGIRSHFFSFFLFSFSLRRLPLEPSFHITAKFSLSRIKWRRRTGRRKRTRYFIRRDRSCKESSDNVHRAYAGDFDNILVKLISSWDSIHSFSMDVNLRLVPIKLNEWDSCYRFLYDE